MKDNLTVRFMVMKEYLTTKYNLTIDEAEGLRHFGYDLCKFELGEDVAEYAPVVTGKCYNNLTKVVRCLGYSAHNFLLLMKKIVSLVKNYLDETSNDLFVLSIQKEELGAIIGALMGFEFDETPKSTTMVNPEDDNKAFGLSKKQIEDIGDGLQPGMAAGVLLIEHVWARDLKKAVREAGGVPIAEGFLTPEAIAEVMVEITAMSDAMNEIEEAEAHNQNVAGAYN